MDPARLRLRPIELADEAAVLAAGEVMGREGFGFLIGYDARVAWADYVAELDRRRRAPELPEPLVPATFLLAEIDGQLVGRTSIRHRLNDRLLAVGGHIGYGVLPDHRRRGYATAILRQAVVIARSYGVDRVLVTCDIDNVASFRTIERCGGVLEDIIDDPDGGAPKRRYWID